jgi:tubulin polyglutamylase TTLL5
MGQSNFNQSYFRILPETFVIPRDYAAFATLSVQLREVDPEQVWIVKPAALSRGRGIYLINNFTELSYNESMVVQRYIKNPLLIDGFKFDLRIYVLVTSFQPLEVFLYKEGFARFASEPFTLDPEE